MKRNETLYETAKFYKNKNISVHINLVSGDWLNGKIKNISKDRLILDEERYGEMLILFARILDDGIKPREEKNGKKQKNNLK